MAERESIAERARRVSMGLITIEQMCRAARLRGQYGDVDARTLAFEIGLVAGEIELDAVFVAVALERARVVSFRVIE